MTHLDGVEERPCVLVVLDTVQYLEESGLQILHTLPEPATRHTATVAHTLGAPR